MLEFIQNYWPVAVILIMVLAALKLASLFRRREQLPYARRHRLVTKSELEFYRSLREAVDDDWAIFAMVRIADLLRVEKGSKDYRAWLNKILSKHIDFVLCDHENLEVALGIELDDPSHQRPDRQERDQFVNQAFEDAGLPLLRVETDTSYDSDMLRQLIDEAIA